MTTLKSEFILIPEPRYVELLRAKILMEILQDIRDSSSDYDFDQFARTLFKKTPKSAEGATDA